jgi:hypothetical protein
MLPAHYLIHVMTDVRMPNAAFVKKIHAAPQWHRRINTDTGCQSHVIFFNAGMNGSTPARRMGHR